MNIIDKIQTHLSESQMTGNSPGVAAALEAIKGKYPGLSDEQAVDLLFDVVAEWMADDAEGSWDSADFINLFRNGMPPLGIKEVEETVDGDGAEVFMQFLHDRE